MGCCPSAIISSHGDGAPRAWRHWGLFLRHTHSPRSAGASCWLVAKSAVPVANDEPHVMAATPMRIWIPDQEQPRQRLQAFEMHLAGLVLLCMPLLVIFGLSALGFAAATGGRDACPVRCVDSCLGADRGCYGSRWSGIGSEHTRS